MASHIELPHRFQEIGLLGCGGTGRVLRVYDREYERDLALKVVTSEAAEWLRSEFDTLRSIRHENLIHVFDWGLLPSGGSYYTMEVVDGGDLGNDLGQPLEEARLRHLLRSILRGLGHLHCHGEIHGDIKPGNILIGRGNVVKVTDIGMGAGHKSLASGTPGYTAPEAWTGYQLSVRSDIYSVGVIAYEALSGKHPFGARTIREVIAGQVDGWVPSLGSYDIRLSQDLERAVMRALERDPDLRYGSADEFLDAIGEGGSVGEILGGQIVARDTERATITGFALSNDCGTPSLLYLCGPDGIGKSSTLAEAIESNVALRGLAHEIQEPERDLAALAGLEAQSVGPLGASGDSIRVSNLSDALTLRVRGGRLLVLEDPPASGDLVRRIARYLWAEASERNACSPVRFIKVVQSPPDVLESFEACVSLGPFDSKGAEALMAGILGKIEPEPAFLRRLLLEVGGSPESLSAALIEMIERRIITRRFGIWRIHELADDDWLSLRTTTSRRRRAWARLTDEEKGVLAAISVVGNGLTSVDISLVFPDVDVSAVAAKLQASGWSELHGDRLKPASRDIVRVAEHVDSGAEVDRTRALVLRTLGERLPRGDRASLLLYAAASPRAVSEGLWFGNECLSTGRYAEALRILTQVRDRARELGDYDSLRAATLRMAEILHQTGSAQQVLTLLESEDEWNGPGPDSRALASRAMLRGLSYKDLRDLDGARKQFQLCASEASRLGSDPMRLRAEAELAEIDWRYGGEAGRERAQERIAAVLASKEYGAEVQDELASLQYQLGAALIMAGKRESAVDILEAALERARSNYWRMRICNALGSAHYYLGAFRTALAASDRAWRHAVEGEYDSFKPRILANAAGIRFGLGLFREAAEQDEHAAFWGRRIGSPFEYEAGLLAAASDLIHTADFERALAAATEARKVASSEPGSRHVAKALEIEALALVHLGDYAAARSLIAEADANLYGLGFDDTTPRLRWHEGRIEMELGNFSAAEVKFSEALTDLERTRDWEDLPGVQVEMQLLFARSGDKRLDPEQLLSLLKDARNRELCLVQLRSTLALAEIAVLYPELLREMSSMLEEGLRLAEGSGAREVVWRMSYWIGRMLGSSGDQRGSFSRISTGVRVLREVASQLTPDHRPKYLATSHARLLLSEAQMRR